MITLLALVAGYAIGSVPTAEWLGRRAGVDLRRQGSANPGANNALRLGGPALGASVLLVEAAKGALAVWAGSRLSGDPGAVAGGLGAVAGNVFNPWYRFGGGKGLGISLGVLATAWPTVVLAMVAVIALGALVTRSSGSAALIAMVVLVVLAAAWALLGWPIAWGVRPSLLPWLAAGMALLAWHRHWRDSPLSGPSPRGLRAPGSPGHH